MTCDDKRTGIKIYTLHAHHFLGTRDIKTDMQRNKHFSIKKFSALIAGGYKEMSSIFADQ